MLVGVGVVPVLVVPLTVTRELEQRVVPTGHCKEKVLFCVIGKLFMLGTLSNGRRVEGS